MITPKQIILFCSISILILFLVYVFGRYMEYRSCVQEINPLMNNRTCTFSFNPTVDIMNQTIASAPTPN